jgi:hypothetical protein
MERIGLFAARTAAALAAAVLVAACASVSFDGPGGDRRLYEARCGVCHVPFPRDYLEPAEWPGMLDDMGPRAGLTKSQRARVLGYLTAPADVR